MENFINFIIWDFMEFLKSEEFKKLENKKKDQKNEQPNTSETKVRTKSNRFF